MEPIIEEKKENGETNGGTIIEEKTTIQN